MSIIGRLFLFGHIINLINNIRFITFIPFKWYHIFIGVYLVALPYFTYKYIVPKIVNLSIRPKVIIPSILIFLITTLDLLNSSIYTKGTFFKLLNLNIQGSYLSEYIMIKNYSKDKKKNYHSKAYQILKSDTSNKMMLILLESMPYYTKGENTIIHKMLQENLGNVYKITYDSIPFYGHTTTAEINELTNRNEEFYHFIDTQQAYHFALPNIKKKQGYHTYAAHSFYISMFRRDLWWKNIGFQHIYGKENILKNETELNYENPFQGVYDERAFDYVIQQDTLPHQKAFYYLLTVNTHFPFNLNHKDSLYKVYHKEIQNLPTDNLKMSFIRFYEQLNYFSKAIKKRNIDLMVIRGDHKPPFLNESETNHISMTQVPLIVIRKIK